MPSFDLENTFPAQVVVGLDEVGRGPWAGPVLACAAYLNSDHLPPGILSKIRDSKKMTQKLRDEVASVLKNSPDGCAYALGEASVEEIDSLNILQATYLAMNRALEGLVQQLDFQVVLVDGRGGLKCPYTTIPVIKGDDLSYSIAAASILAKVTRDDLMTQLHQDFPNYGWDTNAGYGTALHQGGIETHGITPHHRRSFAPIQKVLKSGL